jgi:hypothetical protein
MIRVEPAYGPLLALYNCPETQGGGTHVAAFVCGLKVTCPLGSAFACSEDSITGCGAGAVDALDELGAGAVDAVEELGAGADAVGELTD